MDTSKITYQNLADTNFVVEDTTYHDPTVLKALDIEIEEFYKRLGREGIKCGELTKLSSLGETLFAYADRKLFQIGEERGDPIRIIRVKGIGPHPEIGLSYFTRESRLWPLFISEGYD